MPPSRYLTRLVNLEPLDYQIVRQYAIDKGLGGKGFSAALRMILREWHSTHIPQQNQASTPESPVTNP